MTLKKNLQALITGRGSEGKQRMLLGPLTSSYATHFLFMDDGSTGTQVNNALLASYQQKQAVRHLQFKIIDCLENCEYIMDIVEEFVSQFMCILWTSG